MKVRSFVVAAFVVAPLAGLTACAPEPPPPPDPICYDAAFPGIVDLRYFGPMDTYSNAETVTSTDGSCTGDVFRPDVTLVTASTVEEATTKCTALGATAFSPPVPIGNAYSLGDVYAC